MSKPIRLRTPAQADVDAAIEHYEAAGGPQLAQRFIDDFEATLNFLRQHPASGSPRWSYELRMPGLRHSPFSRFPFLVIYLTRAEEVDVLRIAHAHRDIPSLLIDSD